MPTRNKLVFEIILSYPSISHNIHWMCKNDVFFVKVIQLKENSVNLKTVKNTFFSWILKLKV